MYRFGNWFVKITGVLVKLIFMPTRVFYENKKAQGKKIKGPAIIISNHNTVMDFVIVMFLFWRRSIRCLMAELLYEKNAAMTFLLNFLGGIRVNRDANDYSFIQKSVNHLHKGGIIEIYPEARLPRSDEAKPLPFKTSVVAIALESGAPIIPIYNEGVYFKSGRLNNVIIGTPIDVSELYDESISHGENLTAIAEKLRQRVIELKNELEQQKIEKK